jgi:DNA sulfur modification protein DndD
MILKSVILHNYTAFEGTQEINLTPTGNDEQNIILIGAMNGSGKTSLLESVKLCLYGERGSGLVPQRESETSFINKKFNYNARARHEKKMFIELTFNDVPLPDPHEIKIRRTWTFDSISGRCEKPADLTIYKNSKELELVVREQWQDFVKQIIPDGVSDFFFFDGEKIQQLADDNTDRDSLKESIRNLLGLKIIGNLEVDLSKHIDDIRRESDKVTDSQLRELEAEEAKYEEKIRENREELAEIQNQLYGLYDEEAELEKELRRVTGIGTNNRNQLEQEIANAENEKRKANDEILKLASDTLPFAIAGRLCDELRTRILSEESLRQWEAAKSRVHPQLHRIVSRVFWDESVFRIKPDISPIQKAYYSKLLTDEWEALFMPKPEDAADEAIHELSAKDERFVLGTLDKVSKEIIGNLKDLLTIRERASRRAVDVNRELRNLPEDDTHIGKMVAEFREKSELKRALNEKTGKLEDEIIRFERELKSVQEKIVNLKDKLIVAKKIQSQVSLARKIRSAVQDYEKKLQIRKLSDLEKYTTEMYQRLARKQDFVGEVKIDLRTFDVSIHDPHGLVKEKRSLSAGEKQIYAIALLWGLAKSSDVELPIIIDTPFARLDSEHRTNIAKHYFPFASKQVIILSTDEEIDHRYVQLLQSYVGRSYTIQHNDAKRNSIIEIGYFHERKVA